MYIILIDNVPVPESDIINHTIVSAEKTEFNFSNLIAAKASITLNLLNECRDKYDDEIEGSLFYGSTWYNTQLDITDVSTGLNIFKGRIRSLKKDDGAGRLTVEAVNFVKDIIDKTCVISLGASSDKTPSEIIYSILTDVIEIPTTSINAVSFNTATAEQSANSGYIIATYTQENNIKCSTVINEILKLTSSRLYTMNNIIYYSVIPIYEGVPYIQLSESDILSKSYSTEYNTENIYNSYRIAYKDTTNVAYAVPSSTPDYITYSKSLYGTNTFIVPEDNIESTLASDFKILCKTATSANYYGDLATALNHMAKKIVKLSVKKDFGKVILLNQGVDITYRNLVNEPIRITERHLQESKLTLTAEFMNKPYEAVVRDEIKPDPVTLVSAKCFVDDLIELQWTPSEDLGLYGYRIEFSRNPSAYTGEYSDQGFSPIFKMATSIDTKNGLCYYQLSGLAEGTYYFKIRVVDTARNISDDSNIVEHTVVNITVPSVTPLSYHTTGNMLDGLSFLDGTGQTALSGYTTYDDDTYDDVNYTYAGLYISGLYSNMDDFDSIRIKTKTKSTAEYYNIYYRTYTDGVYGSWVAFIAGIDDSYMTYSVNGINSQLIQFKVEFNIPYLYGTYSSILIKEVN